MNNKPFVPDYLDIYNKFIEIVAMRLHSIDQINSGVMPPNSVTGGWIERYRGTPQSRLPPYTTLEINRFRIEVDSFAAMLMQVVTDSWEKYGND